MDNAGFRKTIILGEEIQVAVISDGRNDIAVAKTKQVVIDRDGQPGIREQQVIMSIEGTSVQPELEEARPHVIMVYDDGKELTCCQKAWRCDEDKKWYNICGKGPAWWPFLLLMYLLLVPIFLAFGLFICACCLLYCFCCSSKDDDEI